MNLVEWCNLNQGFVMAFLTLIYVVATLLILVSNGKSTRLMQENLMLTDKIQKENAKLALHTKRLDAFDSLNQLVIKIHEEGPKSHYLEELLKTCKTMFYLFDDTIDTRVKKILFDIQRLRRVQYEHRAFAKSRKERSELNEHEKHLHDNILQGLNELTDKVNDYLDIGDFGLDINDSAEQTEIEKTEIKKDDTADKAEKSSD